MAEKKVRRKSSLFDATGVKADNAIDEQNLKLFLAAIEEAGKKYNCRLSVARKMMYGQPVFVPVAENIPNQK